MTQDLAPGVEMYDDTETFFRGIHYSKASQHWGPPISPRRWRVHCNTRRPHFFPGHQTPAPGV